MRKLLILGANQETVPLVECALRLGVEVHVADPNIEAPAKTFADKAVDIDATDVEALFRYSIKNKIDGVMVGVADKLIVPYAGLCNRLNLNAYCDLKSAEIWTNKALFNELLEAHGLKTIPSVKVHSPVSNANMPFGYPCLVKPTDSSAGKGITIARSPDELEAAIETALEASSEHCALIEKYMVCDDLFLYSSIFSGELKIVATADRFTTALGENKGKVCFAAKYPSRHQTELINNYQNRLALACKSSGLENGVLLVAAFVDVGKFHFYDPGIRLQGEAPDVHVLSETGIDHKEALIGLALRGDFNKDAYTSRDAIYTSDHFGATLWVLVSPGLISKIKGLGELRDCPHVFEIRQRFTEGTIVHVNTIGTEGQVFVRVYVKFYSNDELADVVGIIRNKLSVIDGLGREMLLDVPYEVVYSHC